jgi:hypothetical protein
LKLKLDENLDFHGRNIICISMLKEGTELSVQVKNIKHGKVCGPSMYLKFQLGHIFGEKNMRLI